jgi:hypothetical protein
MNIYFATVAFNRFSKQRAEVRVGQRIRETIEKVPFFVIARP